MANKNVPSWCAGMPRPSVVWDSNAWLANGGAIVRNSKARIKATATGNIVSVDVISTKLDQTTAENNSQPQIAGRVALYVNGVLSMSFKPTGSARQTFTFNCSPGDSLEFIEGIQYGKPYVAADQGVSVCLVTSATLLPSTTPNKVIVPYGDSLIDGYWAATPMEANSVMALVRQNAAAAGWRVACETGGGRRLDTDTTSSAVLSASAAKIANLLNAASSQSILWFQMGYNDYSLGGLTAAQWGTRMAQFLDEIHTHAPSARVIVQSLQYTINEAKTGSSGDFPSAFRTQSLNVASARSSYCTYVDGLTIFPNTPLSLTSDGIHLTQSTEVTYEAKIRSIVGY